MKQASCRWLVIPIAVLGVLACDDLKDIWDIIDAGGDADAGCDPLDSCCNADGTLAPASTSCDSWLEYRCSDIACGADAQTRTVTQYCTGMSPSCDGDTPAAAWRPLQDCGGNEICTTDNSSYASCDLCSFGCGDGACLCDTSDTCCDSAGTWKTAEVQQPATNLYWLRCPLGQAWEAGDSCGCTDVPGIQTINWCEAVGFADGTTDCGDPSSGQIDVCEIQYGDGYRLPTGGEFSALLEESGLGANDGNNCDGSEDNTMCTDMFGYDSRTYWSSSPGTSGSSAWIAYFQFGQTESFNRNTDAHIRCLRSGP